MAYKMGSLAARLTEFNQSAEHKSRVAARREQNGQKPFENIAFVGGMDSISPGRVAGEKTLAKLLAEYGVK